MSAQSQEETEEEQTNAPWWCPWCEAIIIKDGEVVTDAADAYWHSYNHRDKGPYAGEVMDAFEVLPTVETEQHLISATGSTEVSR